MIIQDVGETATIREITRTYDEYGTGSESVGSTTATAWITPNTAFPQELMSGILDGIDAIGFFKSTDSAIIKNGNEVYATLGSFTIQEVQPIVLGTTTLHLEAVLKQITEL